jgi:hypothetical protein
MVGALSRRIVTCGLAVGVAAAVSLGAQWKFGLMADTQWPLTADDGKNPNSVAVDIINQANLEFVRQGVKFVIAVGDVTDNGSDSALDTRATYAQALYNANIGFYPLRGNHESSKAAAIEFARIFPQTQNGVNNNTPANAFVAKDSANTHPAAKSGSTFTTGSGFGSPRTALSGLSYAFRYSNATLVLLDQFTPVDSSANLVDSQQTWISSTLAGRPAGTFAFVFGHKGLITEDHTDILFGDFASSDSVGQNAFIRSLYQNGVHYYIGGHDHMHDRTIVRSSMGSERVQELVLASDSYKFYTPADTARDITYDSLGAGGCGHTRQVPIAQELYQIGYYIVTVDSPCVTIDYYGVPSGQVSGNIATTPALTGHWSWRESFGYALNGKEFAVAQGQPYTAVVDSFAATKAALLGGTNTSTTTDGSHRPLVQYVGTGWRSSSAVTLPGISSDALTLWGMALAMGSRQTADYALSMSYSAGVAADSVRNGRFGLVSRDSSGAWADATTRNIGGARTFVLGPWSSSYPLGTYGVDTVAHKAWAVLNYNADFAVAGLGQLVSAQAPSARSAREMGGLRVVGNTLVLPRAFAHESVTVEFMRLSGVLLRRVATTSAMVDIANAKCALAHGGLLVRCTGADKRTVQEIVMR